MGRIVDEVPAAIAVGGGGPGAGRGGTAAAKPPGTLEPDENSVIHDEVLLIGCRCRSRFCPHCGPVLGHRLRDSLSVAASAFSEPQLLTLTVDIAGTITGKGFSGPEAAWDAVRFHRYVARLMGELQVERWFWVLEFQQNGSPHWHVLVDGHVDLHRAWHLWRDVWGVGGLKLSKRGLFSNSLHAVRYLTKYLTKFPEHGFPSWVMSRVGGQVRIVSCSRELGALVRGAGGGDLDADDVGDDDDGDEVPWDDEPARPPRTVSDQVAHCRKACVAVRRSLVAATGEERTTWVGDVAVEFDDVSLCVAAGVDVGVDRREVEVPGSSAARVELVVRPGVNFLHVSRAVRELVSSLGRSELIRRAWARGIMFVAFPESIPDDVAEGIVEASPLLSPPSSSPQEMGWGVGVRGGGAYPPRGSREVLTVGGMTA